MPEYQEVAAERRTEARPGVISDLLAGKTLLLPFSWRPGGTASNLRQRGYRLHTHKAADGIIAWLEPLDGAGE